MRNLILIFLLICIIAFVGCTSSSAKVEIYTIEVSGTNGLKFAGSYGGITWEGEKVTQSVDGFVPVEYTVQCTSDTLVYCSFRKQVKAGTLNIYIYKNGQVVAQGGTADEFGSVVLVTN